MSHRAVSLNVDSTGRVRQRVGSQSNDSHHHKDIRIGSASGAPLLKAHLGSCRHLQNSDTINSADSIAAFYLGAAGGAFPMPPSYSLDGRTLPKKSSRQILSGRETGRFGPNIRSNNSNNDQRKDQIFSGEEEARLSATAIVDMPTDLKDTLKTGTVGETDPLETGIVGGIDPLETGTIGGPVASVILGAPRLALKGLGKRGPISSRAVSLNVDSTGRVHQRVGAQSNDSNHHKDIRIGSASGASLPKAHLGSHRHLQNSNTINSAKSALHPNLLLSFPMPPSYSMDGQTLPNESSRQTFSGSETGLHIGHNVRSNNNQQDRPIDLLETDTVGGIDPPETGIVARPIDLDPLKTEIVGAPVDLIDPLVVIHLSNHQEELDSQDHASAHIGLAIGSDPEEMTLTTLTSQQGPTALLEANRNVQLDSDQCDAGDIKNNNHVVEENQAPALPKLQKQRTVFDSHQHRLKSFVQGPSVAKLSVASNLSISKLKRWVRNPMPKYFPQK